MRKLQPHLSQNFLINRELVTKLIRSSSISSSDTVLDIGSGTGIITRELLKITPYVIPIEKDPRFTSFPQDFLTYRLPSLPYKIFANIPFSITGDIIKKILFATNPPLDCYLIIQTAAATKFMTHPTSNTMLAILFYPYFDIHVLHHLHPTNFQPTPKVHICFIRIRPRQLLPLPNQSAYRDFVVHRFTFDRQAKFITPQQFIHLFQNFRRRFPGAFAAWQRQEKNLVKLHRTRIRH